MLRPGIAAIGRLAHHRLSHMHGTGFLRIPSKCCVRRGKAAQAAQAAQAAAGAAAAAAPRPSANNSNRKKTRPYQHTAGAADASPTSSPAWATRGRQHAKPVVGSSPQPSASPASARAVLKKKDKNPEGLSITFAAPAALSNREDPTFVPRNPKVSDGPWNNIDAGLVVAAQKDAELAAAPQVADLKGYVLLGKSAQELAELAQQFDQPAYRGQQLLDGIVRGAHRIEDIPGLPATFKQTLQDAGVKTGRSLVHHQVGSPDGTKKLLLQLEEGRVVETVGIPAQDASSGKQRLTVCVSSQVGCPMRCTFCATGKGGFARNLKPHEVVDQVMTVAELYKQRVSNVVYMGMGEPLLNLSSVVASVEFLQKQLGLSGRAITISTVGVPNAIAKLAQHKLTATLAVSIHAPNQELREKLIPSAKVYPITALMQDCATYFKVTGRRVTFEYTLLGGVNDSPAHAQELAELLQQHKVMSHVNLIQWNPVAESDYQRPNRSKVLAFQRVLESAGVPVSVRTTRGLEAAAACGQLRNEFQKQGLEKPKQLV